MSNDLTERPELNVELLESVRYGSPAEMVAGGATVQQMQTQHATAMSVQQPRALRQVQKNIMVEAGLAGELFYYGWGAGKNKIEGPSVKMALALARCWGNCAIDMMPMQDAGDSWIITAAFVDLETGFTCNRQFRQAKNSIVHGKHDDARKDDIRFQIGQSKAQRNVILNALPEWLIAEAMKEAKRGVLQMIERKVSRSSLVVVVGDALAALAKEGVSEERVLAKFEVAASSALTADHLVMVVADLRAIQEGQDLPDSVYPDPKGDTGNSRTRFADTDDKPAKKPRSKKAKPEDKKPEPQSDDAEFQAAADAENATE